MAAKKSVFFEEEEKEVKLRISVPESLQQRINNVEKKLKALKPSMKFHYEIILKRELESAVIAAEKEIATLEKSNREKSGETAVFKPEITQVKAAN